MSSTKFQTTSGRGRAVPQPSASMLAMQALGLELPFKEDKVTIPAAEINTKDIHNPSENTMNATQQSPTKSYLTKGSSIYSTDTADSMGSRASLDSLETTISQIVELYTNLVDKIPCGDSPMDVPIIQPKAYRDTVAPLLKRRFSSCSVPSAPAVAIIPASYELERSCDPSLRSSYEQAPAFQEFSRNLRKQRSEVVSPCSVVGTDLSPYNSTLRRSPILSPERPFSFIDNQLGDVISMVHEWRCVSPMPEIGHDAPIAVHTTSSRDGKGRKTDRAETALRQVHSSIPPLRYIKSEDLQNARSPPRPSKEHCSLQSSTVVSSENPLMRRSLGGAVKTMIKDRMRKRQDPILDPIRVSTPKGEAAHQPKESYQPTNDKQEVPADGVVQAIKPLSWAINKVEESAATIYRAASSPTNSTHPVKKQEAETWFAKSEPNYRKKRSDTNKSDTITSHSQPNSCKHNHAPKHSRTPSATTTNATVWSVSQERKHGILAALDGMRHSLTQSSADKRREKLKGSITIVGSTELSVINTMASGKSSL